jgi:hypothetical protein
MITFIRDECRRIVAWTWSDNPVDILDCYRIKHHDTIIKEDI